MSIRALKKWALLLTFWVALQCRVLRADQTYSGNLTVTGTVNSSGNNTGTVDLEGDTLTLGTRTDNGNAGAMALYTDGTTSTLEFDASRSANIWKWQQNGGTSLQEQMSLNNNNDLVIYSPGASPTAKITLNPSGTSTFASSVTIGGSIVLTESLGDSRYASISSLSPLISDITIGSGSYDFGVVTGPNICLNGGTATGAYTFAEGNHSSSGSYGSIAMGLYSTASGEASIAMGTGSTASGNYSMAVGINSTASGTGSTAVGRGSTASGYASTAMGQSHASYRGSTAMGASTASGNYATAMGSSIAGQAGATAMGISTASGQNSTAMGFSTANGQSSTAMGYCTTASGMYSTASGYYTQATAYDSFVIGTYNAGTPEVGTGTSSATTWFPTDPLFEIGNGNSGTASNYYTPIKQDALVVYKNGDTAVQGTLTAIGGFVTTQASVQQTDIPMYNGNN